MNLQACIFTCSHILHAWNREHNIKNVPHTLQTVSWRATCARWMSLKFREEAKAWCRRVSDSSFGLGNEFFKVPLPLQAPLLMSQGCVLRNVRCLSLLVLQVRRDKSRINNYGMGLQVAALIYLLLLVDKADSKKGESPICYIDRAKLRADGSASSCSLCTYRELKHSCSKQTKVILCQSSCSFLQLYLIKKWVEEEV